MSASPNRPSVRCSTNAFATSRAQYHLRKTLVALHMLELNQPRVMIAYAGQGENLLDKAGKLVYPTPRKLMQQLLSDLSIWTRRLRLPL